MMLDTLCNIPAKPQEWLCKCVISEGQLTLLMGEPRVGKTMFAIAVIARSTLGQRSLSDLEQRSVWPTSGKLANFDRTKIH